MNSFVFVPVMEKDVNFTGNKLEASTFRSYSLDAAKNAAEKEHAGVHFFIHDLMIDPDGVVVEDRGVVAEVDAVGE